MHSFRRIALAALVVSSATFTAANAQRGADSTTAAIDRLLGSYHGVRQFNGVALVARGDSVLYRKAFGKANMEWNVPMTTDAKFRVGSITKQFTAMLTMQLVAEGKVKLEGPVIDYIPEYPESTGKLITIHHLLTHTSGLPNYTADPLMATLARSTVTPIELVATFWRKPLDFEPGARFSYNNSGYVLLGAIIERVTGKRYEEVLQEKILRPLGMSNSGYDHSDPIIEHRAAGYSKAPIGYVNAAFIDMSVPYAAGALYFTADDLHRWHRALMGETLLPEKYKAMLFTPYVSMGEGFHYGYGWMTKTFERNGKAMHIVAHGGAIPGFGAMIYRIVESGEVIILLDNTGQAGSLAPLADGINEILSGRTPVEPVGSIVDALLPVIEREGIIAAVGRFHAAVAERPKRYAVNENEMNMLGYHLLRQGRTKEAIEIFKLNVEAFPASFNVFDSLGEAYAADGATELAIVNYKKSVELNPKNQSGIDALKRLQR